MELIGRHYLTGTPLRLQCENGVILAVDEFSLSGASTLPFIAPALFDLQVNGYGGVDFQQPSVSATDWLNAARALRRDGCARFLAALVTQDWSQLLKKIRDLQTERNASPELRHAVPGLHLEGPFFPTSRDFAERMIRSACWIRIRNECAR